MVAWRSGSASALQALGRGFKSLSDHQIFDGLRVFRDPFFDFGSDFRALPDRRACLFSADVVPGSCQVSARFFRFRASFLQENDAFLEVCCQVFARIIGKAD